MRKGFNCFAVLFLFTISVSAQYINFVELKDSTVIRGKVELSTKLFRSSKIIVNDTTEIPLSKVHAYQTTDGYFRRMYSGYGDSFAKRLEKGNIDLFTRTQSYEGGGSFVPGPNGTSMFVGGGMHSSQVEYFSKDGGELQKANARNLKRALFDNPESMEYLKKRDGMTVVQVLGVIAGVAIAATSLASQSDSEEISMPPGAFVGVMVISGSSWIPYLQKEELTRKAIKAYNR
ncbi:MAG: hypothetical protein RIC57_00810 [Balneola sp.]|jgi:hypothetical protein